MKALSVTARKVCDFRCGSADTREEEGRVRKMDKAEEGDVEGGMEKWDSSSPNWEWIAVDEGALGWMPTVLDQRKQRRIKGEGGCLWGL